MYFTVYKTTNLINGRIYIGVHKTEDLDDNYLGSGTYLLNAIKKYGRENFSKDIIAICDTEEEMYKLEEDLVCQAFLTFFSTYNIVEGGHGGASPGLLGGIKTKELYKDPNTSRIIKEKISLSLKETIKTNGGFFKSHIHKENSKKNIGEKNKIAQKGDKNSQYGTFWITNEVINKKIKLLEEVPRGWRKGRIRP